MLECDAGRLTAAGEMDFDEQQSGRAAAFIPALLWRSRGDARGDWTWLASPGCCPPGCGSAGHGR